MEEKREDVFSSVIGLEKLMEKPVKKEDKGFEEIQTPGGFAAIVVNDQIIRKSNSPRRLEEDGETYDEYKVRRKLTNQIEKERTGKVFWMSRFQIGKQWYTNTYNKAVVEKNKQKLKEKEDETNIK